MFTGLIEAIVPVVSARRTTSGLRLEVERPDSFSDVAVGDSIAVNGACLTAAARGDTLIFDAVSETVSRTTLGQLTRGARVNLERSVALGSRLGGHIVLGHVDGIATVASISAEAQIAFQAPPGLLELMLPKGSVAVNGVSLTLVDVGRGSFSIAAIPYTLGATNLGGLRERDRVNIETDILGKYVKRLLGNPGEISEDFLREHGFA